MRENNRCLAIDRSSLRSSVTFDDVSGIGNYGGVNVNPQTVALSGMYFPHALHELLTREKYLISLHRWQTARSDLEKSINIHRTLSERVAKTTSIEKKTMDIEERGVRLRLTIVDTPGEKNIFFFFFFSYTIRLKLHMQCL